MFLTQVLSVTDLSVITIKPQDNHKVYTAFIFFKVSFNNAVICSDLIASVKERTRITGEVTLTGECRSFQKEKCPPATSSTINPTRTVQD
jgi:hypothetical protein